VNRILGALDVTGSGSAVRRTVTGLIVGAVAIAIVTLAIAALKGSAEPVAFTGLYLFAILPVAIGWGFLAAGMVAVASYLTFAFFFASPVHNLRIDESETEAALVISLLAAYVVSHLARRAQERTREAHLRTREAEQAQGELRTIAAEQAALQRVARLVAQAAPTDEVFEAVTREVGLQCDAELARMERFESDRTVTAIAAWSKGGEAHLAIGTRLALEGASIALQVRETGRPARVDSFVGASGPIAAEAQALGIRSSVGCPIVVSGRAWGVIAASTTSETPFPPDTESRISEFTELAATSIANAEARDELRRVADEQAALRRVATLVARAEPPRAVFAAVAQEVARLLSADLTALTRYDAGDMLTTVAVWSASGDVELTGLHVPIDDSTIGTLVRDTRAPARMDQSPNVPTQLSAELGIGSLVAAPITVAGRLWGQITVASVGEEVSPPGTEDRLGGFAELVATAVANAESQAEVRASRARIVTTADETRRRIERDLHDGAQQRLVSLALQLRGAQAAVPPGLSELEADLEEIAGGINDVFDEVRELARGLHPAVLAEGGLGAALKTLARRSTVPITLEVRTEERLPQPIEVAAYFVVSEALANAAKHADASSVAVQVATVDGVLRVAVRDDGVGGAELGGGSGLVGLKDRVEALGGRIGVESPPHAGTEVSVELPLAGEPG
jgi:signal transduction histidine kinase